MPEGIRYKKPVAASGEYDAVIVGSGPNGFAAAITIAQSGRKALVLEANETLGGGARSAELTLPGFVHDTCSAVHPLAAASPFFKTLPLEKHGLVWIDPPVAVAHPFDDGTAALLYRSVEKTAETLGEDAAAYRKLMKPYETAWPGLFDDILQPPIHFPRHPFLLAGFGLKALLPVTQFVKRFRGKTAKGLFAGLAGHSFLPLTEASSSAIGMVMGIAAHAAGWPFPRGGAQQLTNALASHFRSLGGEIRAGAPVRSAADLPKARAVLFDLTPRQVLRIAGDRLPSGYRRGLERFRYGPGVFKIDLALSGPIPWTNAKLNEAGTLHLGGTIEEIAISEGAPGAEKPYVLLSQPCLFDPSRAPAGKHIVWAYCHVPNGSTLDMTERIEAQIERFAPGFRKLVIARHVTTPADLERTNANYIGGDIAGGATNLRQILFRPVARLNPYKIPVPGWYFCSASTPPGAGVHGMCGHLAAKSALASEF